MITATSPSGPRPGAHRRLSRRPLHVLRRRLHGRPGAHAYALHMYSTCTAHRLLRQQPHGWAPIIGSKQDVPPHARCRCTMRSRRTRRRRGWSTSWRKASRHGQTRRPGSVSACHPWLEAPLRLRTAALCAHTWRPSALQGSSYGHLGPAVQPRSAALEPPRGTAKDASFGCV